MVLVHQYYLEKHFLVKRTPCLKIVVVVCRCFCLESLLAKKWTSVEIIFFSVFGVARKRKKNGNARTYLPNENKGESWMNPIRV